MGEQAILILDNEEPTAARQALSRAIAAGAHVAGEYGQEAHLLSGGIEEIDSLAESPGVLGLFYNRIPERVIRRLDAEGRRGARAWNECVAASFRAARRHDRGLD